MGGATRNGARNCEEVLDPPSGAEVALSRSMLVRGVVRVAVEETQVSSRVAEPYDEEGEEVTRVYVVVRRPPDRDRPTQRLATLPKCYDNEDEIETLVAPTCVGDQEVPVVIEVVWTEEEVATALMQYRSEAEDRHELRPSRRR
jgi:hypothetical protein